MQGEPGTIQIGLPALHEGRSLERLRFHYEIERELSDRLRSASREERSALYGQVYDELFRRVSDHPQLVHKADAGAWAASLAREVKLLLRYLPAGATFLELGAGDCALSLAMAEHAGMVYAIDVSEEISSRDATPSNFELILSDGREIPVPGGSVDLAYSNQLMEHLHPDDALEQLRNLVAALSPTGAYICRTPNRLSGPHDISALFDDVPRGFHLREYTSGELRDLVRTAGFRDATPLGRLKGWDAEIPAAPVIAIERLIGRLPPKARRRAAQLPIVRNSLHAVIARKGRVDGS